MKTLKLNTGNKVLLDDVDYEKVRKWTWFEKRGYAARNFYVRYEHPKRIRKWTSMHRYILDAPDGMEVDHINGNTLDNRRDNLRLVTKTQNQANRRVNRTSKTGLKGVWYDPTMQRRKRWVASISIDGKAYRIGRFDTKEEAAHIYDQWATGLRGEYARLNLVAGGSS